MLPISDRQRGAIPLAPPSWPTAIRCWASGVTRTPITPSSICIPGARAGHALTGRNEAAGDKKMWKRLSTISVFVLMGSSAFSAEHLTFPSCVNNICRVDDTLPLVRLSPAELAQMRDLNERAYDILIHASHLQNSLFASNFSS
jgi:hypothetical protein